MTRECSCRGENPNCSRCQGSGELPELDNSAAIEAERVAHEAAKVMAQIEPGPKFLRFKDGRVFQVVDVDD